MKSSALIITISVAAIALAGCTSSKGASGRTSSDASAACTSATAKPAKQSFVDAAGFMPACVSIKAGSLFSIVNSSAVDHAAVTQPGAPASFVADLPGKNSTFSKVFTKKGSYTFADSVSKKTLTLFVT